MSRVYLDYHATTPVDPAALEAMLPYFGAKFGNAASRSHAFGWEAEEAVEVAREQVAALIGATAKEIIWTSGATEATNLAIKGAAEMYGAKGRHLVTSVVEHKATLDTCKYLETQGWTVTYLPVDATGQVALADVEAALRPDTVLVSLIHANNEVGTINPIEPIGRLLKARGVLFHIDAAQSFGKVPIDVEAMGIDLLSVSGHKIYAPKGVGALFVRRKGPRVRLAPQMHGGGHERGMRSGTLNVPGIVALGVASQVAQAGMAEEAARLSRLRDRLHGRICEALEEVHLNGHPTERLSGNLNLSFAFVEGESLLMGLKNIAVSSGSACTSASLEPSYVLRALGLSDELAHASIRYGLGRYTTEADVDAAATATIETVSRLREMSPLYEMWKEGVDLGKVQWQPH